jgi:molecular chaperone GrpE (heat shock protein)
MEYRGTPQEPREEHRDVTSDAAAAEPDAVATFDGALSGAVGAVTDLRRAIDALPELRPEGADESGGEPAAAATPLDIVSRQGRLILRLSAAAESLEARYKQLADAVAAREERLSAAEEEALAARQQARRMALEAVRLMDALDWVQEALAAAGGEAAPLAREVASAQRDCLGRLAAAGLTPVPAEPGAPTDGRLHEGLEAVETDAVPQYHIVRVLRRGWQMGPDVLRRAGVVTAA